MASWSVSLVKENHESKSSEDPNTSGSKKLSSAQSSCILFCSGVPVTNSRFLLQFVRGQPRSPRRQVGEIAARSVRDHGRRRAAPFQNAHHLGQHRVFVLDAVCLQETHRAAPRERVARFGRETSGPVVGRPPRCPHAPRQ